MADSDPMRNPGQLPTHFFIVAVEAAVVKDGRYLMIVRSEEETHAPGTLTFPGGKVENVHRQDDVLEKTLAREVMEETGVRIEAEVRYVESHAFEADDNDSVVGMVFLCRFKDGEAQVNDPAEVREVLWLTYQEILDHPKSPPWTRASIKNVEQHRLQIGW